jgi:hypothetical protein
MSKVKWRVLIDMLRKSAVNDYEPFKLRFFFANVCFVIAQYEIHFVDHIYLNNKQLSLYV